MARYFYIPSETKLGKGFQRTKKYSNFAFGKFIFFVTNLPGGRQGHEDTKDFFCEKIKKNEVFYFVPSRLCGKTPFWFWLVQVRINLKKNGTLLAYFCKRNESV